MKHLTKTILAVLVTGFISSALFSQQAEATMINGDIGFTGSVTFDTNSLDTATRVNEWRDANGMGPNHSTVSSTTGDFNVIALGTQANMATPWIFNPSTNTPGLWSVGGFTFNLLSSTIVMQNASTLSISGMGTITGGGFDPTPGEWAFTTQSSGGKTRTSFTFSANVNTIPDGGSAVGLLGIALTGIEVLRRRLRRRQA